MFLYGVERQFCHSWVTQRATVAISRSAVPGKDFPHSCVRSKCKTNMPRSCSRSAVQAPLSQSHTLHQVPIALSRLGRVFLIITRTTADRDSVTELRRGFSVADYFTITVQSEELRSLKWLWGGKKTNKQTKTTTTTEQNCRFY